MERICQETVVIYSPPGAGRLNPFGEAWIHW